MTSNMAFLKSIRSKLSNGAGWEKGEIESMLSWLKEIRRRAIDEEKRTDSFQFILCRKLMTLQRVTEAGILLVNKIKWSGHTLRCLGTSFTNVQDAIRIFAIRKDLTTLLPERVFIRGKLLPQLQTRLGRLIQRTRYTVETARMRWENETKEKVDFNRLRKVARGEISVTKPSPMERINSTHRDVRARFQCRKGSRIAVKPLTWRNRMETVTEDILEEESKTLENQCHVNPQTLHVAEYEVAELPHSNENEASVAVSETQTKLLTTDDDFLSAFINNTIYQASLKYETECKNMKDGDTFGQTLSTQHIQPSAADSKTQQSETLPNETANPDESEDAILSPRHLKPLPTITTRKQASKKAKKKKRRSGQVSPLTLAPLSPRGLGASALPPIASSPGSSTLSSPRSTSSGEVPEDVKSGNCEEGANITDRRSDDNSATSVQLADNTSDVIWPKTSGGSISLMDIYDKKDLDKDSVSSSAAPTKEKKKNVMVRAWRRFRVLFRRNNKVAPQ